MKNMRNSGLSARRAIGRVAAMSLVTMSAMVGGVLGTTAIANADSAGPDSAEAEYVVNEDDTVTVTVDGTWRWERSKDCNIDRYGTGWAVDWNDETQPGNPVARLDTADPDSMVDVGALEANDLNDADNAVHNDGVQGCGEWIADEMANVGTFGPISHTYPAGTESIDLCVVTYDLHLYRGDVKAADLIAGGSSRNKDNSLEDNYDDTRTCIPVHIDVEREAIETDVSIEKTTSDSSVVAGDSFEYTLTVTNNGEYAAETVEILDSVPVAFTIDGVTEGDFDCAVTDQDIDCDLAELAAGESASVTVSVTTADGATLGVHTNTATVSTTTAGDDPDNNSDSVDVTVNSSESNPPPLPETGSSSDGMLLAALLASVAGVTALVASRRRRDAKV